MRYFAYILACLVIILASQHTAIAAKTDIFIPIVDSDSNAHANLSCTACHKIINNNHKNGHALRPLSETCITCHSDAAEFHLTNGILTDPNNYNKEDCLACHPQHEKDGTGSNQSVDFNNENIECLRCHGGINRAHTSLGLFDNNFCLQCHRAHPESKFGELHHNVDCVACHSSTGQIVLHQSQITNIGALKAWEHPKEVKRECSRCHYPRNGFGAPGTVLPRRGVTCMPCHTAALTVEDYPSKIGIAVLFLGSIFWILLIFSTGPVHTGAHKFYYISLKNIFHGLICDILLQRKLYISSIKRWYIHACFSLSIIFRFSYGVIATLSNDFFPGSLPNIIYKNNPATAFMYDLTGMAIIIGSILMVKMRIQQNCRQVKRLILPILLGAISVTGFILEGMRIAVTHFQDDSAYAFLGFVIARGLSYLPNLDVIYGYAWYIHSIILLLFVAALPFSKLFHVVTAPILILIKSFERRA